MSNDTSQTEKLINYIDGDMTDAEKGLLEQQLPADESMQQELNDLLLARDVIKNHGLANRVAAVHLRMMEEMQSAATTAKTPVRSLYRRVMKYAAAAILLLGLFSVYQYMNISADKLYGEQYNGYNLAAFRGNEVIPPLEKAYAEKKYGEVISGYKQLYDASVKQVFIAGQSYLAKENYAEAATCFKTVISKNESANTGILADDAEYYLALSYLKNDQPGDAFELFKKIKNNSQHLYNNKVSSWFLKKLQILTWKKS